MYGQFMSRSLPFRVPVALSKADQRALVRSVSGSRFGSSRLEGVNLLSHFCSPSGIQQAALWVRAALETVGCRTSCRDVPVPRRVVPIDRDQYLGMEIFPVTILNQAATPFFKSGFDRSGFIAVKMSTASHFGTGSLKPFPMSGSKLPGLVDEIWSPTEFVAGAMRAGCRGRFTTCFPGWNRPEWKESHERL